VLGALGVRYDPVSGAYEVPDEATIRDVLERVDASAFTAATGAWLPAIPDDGDPVAGVMHLLLGLGLILP
jgi:hypothetical protein